MPAIDEKSPPRRKQLVEATVALLLEAGLRATKTRDVTERAGVGTGLLNHYFRWPELRALAWRKLFEAVIAEQFNPSGDPRADLERYFATAFTDEARRFWHLWIEATELAASDGAMRDAFSEVSAKSRHGLRDLLVEGHAQRCWHLPDPNGTATRLSALYDGLAGMLMPPAQGMHPAQAEAHLRKAFELECQKAQDGSPDFSSGKMDDAKFG